MDRMLGCLPCTQEVEGSTPTGGTCPNDLLHGLKCLILITMTLFIKPRDGTTLFSGCRQFHVFNK